LQMSRTQDIHHRAHQNEMWTKYRSLSLKTKASPPTKLLTCWEFNLCQLTAFWKTIWKCITLPPNSCLTCWVKSRRRIIWTHARTVKRELNETQKLITDVEIRLHRLRHRKKR